MAAPTPHSQADLTTPLYIAQVPVQPSITYAQPVQQSSRSQPYTSQAFAVQPAMANAQPASPPYMMHDTQPSSPAESSAVAPPAPAPPCNAVPLVAQSVTQLIQVQVPSDVMAGQEVAFITPDGQTMRVTVTESYPAGSTIAVQYLPQKYAALAPMPQPNLNSNQQIPTPAPARLPTVQVRLDADNRATKLCWFLYVAAWAVCCIMPCVAPLIWAIIAATYFCKPTVQRNQSPNQRTPAYTALITCCIVSVFLAIGMGMFASGFDPERINNHRFHPHGFHPHGFHPLKQTELREMMTMQKFLSK